MKTITKKAFVIVFVLIFMSGCGKDMFSFLEVDDSESEIAEQSDGTDVTAPETDVVETPDATPKTATINLLGITKTTIMLDHSEASTSYLDTDIEKTLKALDDTGFNFFSYSMSDGDVSYDCDEDGDGNILNDSSGYGWCTFKKMVAYAYTNYPHITFYAYVKSHRAHENRWTLTDEDLSDETYLYSEENYRRILSGNTRAAIEISKLANKYPNVKYWGIDDFSVQICSPHNTLVGSRSGYYLKDICFTRDDIKRMIDASHNCTGCSKDLKFLPVFYYQNLPELTYNSHAFGSNRGTKWYADYDTARMRSSFTLDKMPSSAILSFQHYDWIGKDEEYYDTLKLKIIVNGNTVADDSIFTSDGYMEKSSYDIHEYLCAPDNPSCSHENNSISYTMYSTSDMTAYSTKVLYLWDIQIQTDENTITKFTTTYDTTYAEGVSYTFDDETITSNKDRIIAMNNDDYRLQGYFDGALVFYNNEHDDIVTDDQYQELVDYTATAFADAIYVPSDYAWDDDAIDTSRLRARLKAGIERTGNYLYSQFPLFLRYPSNGIFSAAPSTLSGYDYVIPFLKGTYSVDGWFQKYTANSDLIGDVTFDMYENRTCSSESCTLYLTKQILDKDDQVLYESEVGTDELADESTTLSIRAQDNPISFKVNMVAGYGALSYLVYFQPSNAADGGLYDPSGRPVSWTMTSGMSNKQLNDTYCTIIDSISELKGITKSDDLKFDPDGDGQENCTVN